MGRSRSRRLKKLKSRYKKSRSKEAREKSHYRRSMSMSTYRSGTSGRLRGSLNKYEVAHHDDMHVETHPSSDSALTRVKMYVEKLLQKGINKPAAVFDIDETVLQYVEKCKGDVQTEYARTMRGMRDFVNFLRKKGVAIRFITARRESGRESTIEDLEKLKLWKENDTLMMKPNHYPSKSSSIAKHFQRTHIVEKMGHTIVVNVGDQMSDMLPESDWGWFTGVVLKLPDCKLKRSLEKSVSTSKSPSSVLEKTMSEFNDHLVFLWLESDVAISWKLPNTKWYTV